MGKPFQPWQHYVANTAGEIDPVTGRLVYGLVTLTLPRQNGKTTLTVPVMTHRCLAWKRQVVLYAAQTREEALKKLQRDHEPLLRETPYSDRFITSWNNNAPGLTWDNGSHWGVTSTTKTAGHGPTLHMGVLDEAWAQKDNRVEAAWLPAMLTTDSQMWIISTAGNADSQYFHDRIDQGRELVASGSRQDIAHFEWSADEKADPFDPATWYSCMPALGHTVTEAKIRGAQLAMVKEPGEFARAYCNIRQGTGEAVAGPIDMAAWESSAHPRSRLADTARLAVGVEVDVDQAYASVVIVGLRADGRMHVEMTRHDRGTAWVVPYLLDRRPRWHPIGIGVDLGGPAGSLRSELAAAFELWKPSAADDFASRAALLTVPTVRDYVQASGELVAALEAGRLVHLGAEMQPPLTRAAAGAGKRPVGDAWAFARRGNASIAPLVAATLARWVYLTRAPAYDRDDYDVAMSVY